MAEGLLLPALLAGLGFVLAGARFVLGPRSADRVAAFDVLTVIAMAGIVLVALATGRAIYLDVALVYALLSFLGVIVAARYIEGGK